MNQRTPQPPTVRQQKCTWWMKGSGNASLLEEVIIKIPSNPHPLARCHFKIGMRSWIWRVSQMIYKKIICPLSLPIMIHLSERLPPLTSKRKEGSSSG